MHLGRAEMPRPGGLRQRRRKNNPKVDLNKLKYIKMLIYNLKIDFHAVKISRKFTENSYKAVTDG